MPSPAEASKGSTLPGIRVSLCYLSTLTHHLSQNSKRFAKSGRLVRRRRRTSARLTKSVLATLPSVPPLRVNLAKVLPPPATKLVVQFSSHRSDTNLVPTYLDNTKPLLPAVSSSYQSILTKEDCSTLDTQPRHMAHLHSRCIANVITPSFHPLFGVKLTSKADNGGPPAKYEH